MCVWRGGGGGVRGGGGVNSRVDCVCTHKSKDDSNPDFLSAPIIICMMNKYS